MVEAKTGDRQSNFIVANKMGMKTSHILPDYKAQCTYITIDARRIFYFCCEKAHIFHCTIIIRLPFIILAQTFTAKHNSNQIALLTQMTNYTVHI